MENILNSRTTKSYEFKFGPDTQHLKGFLWTQNGFVSQGWGSITKKHYTVARKIPKMQYSTTETHFP